MGFLTELYRSLKESAKIKVLTVVYEDKVVFNILNRWNEGLKDATIYLVHEDRMLGSTDKYGKLELDKSVLPSKGTIYIEYGIYSTESEFIVV